MLPLRPPDLPRNAVYTSCYCEENIYLLCDLFSSVTEIAENWLIWVVFISNEDKKVALFFQKASTESRLPVVWDYHVILLLQPRSSRDERKGGDIIDQGNALHSRPSWVYDFDTNLSKPCQWDDYLALTCPLDLLPEYQRLYDASDARASVSSPNTPESFCSYCVAHGFILTSSSFRVIPAQVYLDNFASDRSHMKMVKPATDAKNDVLPVYSSPPPSYGAICGAEAAGRGERNNLMSHFVSMRAQSFGDVVGRLRV